MGEVWIQDLSMLLTVFGLCIGSVGFVTGTPPLKYLSLGVTVTGALISLYLGLRR